MSSATSPTMPPSRSLIECFSRSLSAFTSSPENFRVLATLPHHSPSAPSSPAPRQPTAPIRNLIVLDSSFNPPTTAHASMIRAATAPGDRILLLLAVENADKAAKPASFPHRLAMMEALGRELSSPDSLSTQSNGTDVDVAVTTKPFFHDKAHQISTSAFYAPSGADMTFLAGYDTLIRIFQPKYYGGAEGMREALDGFFSRAKLRVTMRTDGEWGGREEQEAYVRDLKAEGGKLEELGGRREWMERVEVVEGFEDGVSSSRVRGVVKRGERVDGFVGEDVGKLIVSEGLYKES